MSRKRQRKWVVRRNFEPSRLSQAIMEQAYAKVVPHHIRVLRLPAGRLGELHEACQPPRERSVA